MSDRGKYKCLLCDWTSNPESSSQKRSASMHIAKQHKEEVPEGTDKSEYWGRVTDTESEKTTKNESEKREERTRKNQSAKNEVYIIQAKFDTNFEAENKMKTFINQKPDCFKDFTHQKDNYILIKCSTRETAKSIKKEMNQLIHPVSSEIFTEIVDKGSGSSGIRGKITGALPSIPFRTEENSSITTKTALKTKKEPVTPEKVDREQIIGHSISADDYRHFQRTEADASDMEGLMMTRQQIAKGESMGGTDVMKWVSGISVLLIVIVVVIMMLQGVDLTGMLGVGGEGASGGGGGAIP